MSLSKRQKILSGVFVIGLVGLAADRTILRPQGGPKAASAESLTLASNAPVRPGSTPADANSPTRTPLAERLSRLLPQKEDDSIELRDPFALPASWSDNRTAKKERIPDATEVFARGHQLRAVVVQGEDVCAQVDDSFLVPGQTIDGFTLISVDYRSAIFEREDRRVTLELVVK